MTLTGIDIRLVVNELQDEIIGTWIVNIYHLPNNIFIFKLRKPQVGLSFLLIEPGKRIHLTQFNRTMPKAPSNYCKILRSHLKDRRINSITQRDIDRIISINIGPDEGSELVVELFGFGNLILNSPENKILGALIYRKMKDRDIHPGRIFQHMPSQERDLLRHGTEDLDAYLNNTQKVIYALNSWLGLGPYYSRYVIRTANLSTKNSSKLTAEDKESIVQVSNEIRDRMINNNFEPLVYLDQDDNEVNGEDNEDLSDLKVSDDDIVDSEYDDQWADDLLPFKPEDVTKILPWDLLSPKDGIEKFVPDSYNIALDIYYSSQETHSNIDEETEELETEADRLTRLMEKQQEHKDNFDLESAKHQKYGDLLYANFQPGTDLIATVYDARRKNMPWEEIESRLQIGKDKKISSAMLFKTLKKKEAKMILQIQDDDTLVDVEVDFRKSLVENANIFYQSSKKSGKKFKGAIIAINKTLEKIENAKGKVVESKSDVQKSVMLLKRRKAWYEKFHWTITPNDTLIIAGTDATTNERIVKKYLEADDLFIHGNMHGAPATIIKSGGREINDKTIRIAAKLAVGYSSSWKAKQVIADAFVVDPEQVSFTPPSGEFLPKGSFMIYGQKNFIRDIEIEMYIGLIVEHNWIRLMSGPKECIEGLDYWVKLKPGDQQRGTLAKQIKKKFSAALDEIGQIKLKAVDLGELASLIPGDSQIDSWKTN